MTYNENITDRIENLEKEELYALRGRIDDMLTAMDPVDSDASAPLPQGAQPQSRACRLFNVTEGVRRLNKKQLKALTEAFSTWLEASRDARTRRSRERVFLVFLMLRYTGARLGEVLALDERRDFDFIRSVVLIPDGSEKREVPLPKEVIARIRSYCVRYHVGTVGENSEERIFDLDQGFIRRKFYEQEERSGLPKDFLNPRVLRNSRAIELLQGGMPMRAVQVLLGHSKTDYTASYVTLTDEDLHQIIHQHFRKEFGMETSVRNTFRGEIISINANEVMCEVSLKTDSGNEVVGIITNESRQKLALAVGKEASAMIKATWVILEKPDAVAQTSARNAFPGVITNVVSDDIVTEVSGTLDDGTPVCALITAGSFDRLGIGKGDSFIFMFKAMSVILS